MAKYKNLKKKYLVMKNGKCIGLHVFAKNKSELRKQAKYKNVTFKLARYSSQPKAVRQTKYAKEHIPELITASGRSMYIAEYNE